MTIELVVTVLVVPTAVTNGTVLGVVLMVIVVTIEEVEWLRHAIVDHVCGLAQLESDDGQSE